MMPKLCRSNSESVTFDEAISLTGYGRFHYEAIAVCSLSIIIVGFQNGISSYIFPPAQCELNLTSLELGFLNVCFLIGGTVSCFLWGLIADNHGRKKVLIFAHLCNVIVTMVSAVNPYTATLVSCRFINGFLMGAPGSLMYTYIAEFQPSTHRFRTVCILGLFFIASWLFLPVLAYLILPVKIYYNFKNIFIISPWRVFLLIIAIPEILVCLWLTRLPESPKFYIAKGNHKKTLKILKRIYSANSGKSPELFPVKTIICEVYNNLQNSEVMVSGKTARVLKEVTNQIRKLFQKPFITKTFVISAIMFSNMFGLFGLGLWLPELFIKFEKYHLLHPNSTVTIEELSSLPQDSEKSCQPSFDQSVIISTVATGSTALIFNGISCLISTRVSSRNITLMLTFLGGICAACIYWLTTSLQNLIVSCIFQATMLTANMSITSIAVELFPTSIGGMAVCFVICAGRIGAAISNVVFAFLMDDYCQLAIFAVAFVQIIGGILCFLVPSQKKCHTKAVKSCEETKLNNLELAAINNQSIYPN
ncbi:unnamed protein product [Diabrotica balteata]|uniref:Major facilitator superfamily (MFS) profile domain-containing protein n=1 Tax=Diabrotica balteata TaxID=107213 RepID=A0A9N9X4Z8_DIABA|nr:unnamed protein product [Diabrotica balteata]